MLSVFRVCRKPVQNDAKLNYEEGLRHDLQLAKWELDNAYAGFDYVTDPDLVDCYIYQLNAAMKRYEYLLGKFSALQKEILPADDERLSQQQLSRESALQPIL